MRHHHRLQHAYGCALHLAARAAHQASTLIACKEQSILGTACKSHLCPCQQGHSLGGQSLQAPGRLFQGFLGHLQGSLLTSHQQQHPCIPHSVSIACLPWMLSDNMRGMKSAARTDVADSQPYLVVSLSFCPILSFFWLAACVPLNKACCTLCKLSVIPEA